MAESVLLAGGPFESLCVCLSIIRNEANSKHITTLIQAPHFLVPEIVAQELVLIMWGIFFVAIHNGPHCKGRDVMQAVREGTQNVVKGATSIASKVGTRRDSGTSSLSESKEVEVVPTSGALSGITSEVTLLL